MKGGSSKWIHETFPEHRLFAWQEEYGAFSVSVSQLDKTIEYIKGQEAHHRKMTFQEEFLALLKKNIALNTTNGICGNEFQPSLRDSFIHTGHPALKRRAIFGMSRWDK